MAKDTFYFPHDYNPRTDSKIKKLIRTYGMLGYGIFWALVEDLYNNDNSADADYENYSFEYRVSVDVIKSIINDFELFIVDSGKFSSNSVERRLSERKERSDKAKDKANKRWNNATAMLQHSHSNADAMPQQCKGNAKKERKEKEIKEKNIISLPAFKETFLFDLQAYKDKYPSDMLNEFYLYWTEPLQSNPNRCRQMVEKTWDLSGRLARWAINYKPKQEQPNIQAPVKKQMVY